MTTYRAICIRHQSNSDGCRCTFYNLSVPCFQRTGINGARKMYSLLMNWHYTVCLTMAEAKQGELSITAPFKMAAWVRGEDIKTHRATWITGICAYIKRVRLCLGCVWVPGGCVGTGRQLWLRAGPVILVQWRIKNTSANSGMCKFWRVGVSRWLGFPCK